MKERIDTKSPRPDSLVGRDKDDYLYIEKPNK